MNTSQIKKFAIAARKVLLQGVINKISTLGFNAQGQFTLAQMPVLAYNDTNFNGRIIPGTSFYYKLHALHRAIQQKVVKAVYEEVAYTWFNRLVAIRILQNQDTQLIANVLDFVDDSNTPSIVNDARHGILPKGMDENTTNELNRLLCDDTKTTEQFTILISAFCEATPILRMVFVRIDVYTELLLPIVSLAKNGFVDMLNNTEFITTEDYKQTELIGWLYQFYISERKDEVFDLGEWSAEDIPAGTQIFTPNWIVKYMVENTLGRIYLDNNPDSSLGNEMKYLVEQSEGEHPIFEFEKVEDLRCADFSCGSGHILGEFFEMLYRFYTEERWYGSRDAIESIFRHNLFGIDLDTRATQLSTFALLLKACQKDESFIDAEVMPQVLDMPSITFEGALPIVDQLFARFNATIKREVTDAFKLMEKANELGSIMKFKLTDISREAMATVVSDYYSKENADKEIIKSMDLILMLTDKYSVICMNPPYMAAKHMDSVLSNYASQHYPKSKNDLFSVFMDVAYERLFCNAKYGMINMQAWMYNTYFRQHRENVLTTQQLDNVIHLGPHTFDELSGEIVQNVSFVITKHIPIHPGIYYRLVSGANCSEKEQLFLSKSCIYYGIDQNRFAMIDESPMGSYWATDNIMSMFVSNPQLSTVAEPCVGLQTAGNSLFIRFWHEVSNNNIGYSCANSNEALLTGKKWFPCNKGGGQRKWYGNQSEVINWQNNGIEIKNHNGAVIRNEHCYFKPSVTWNMISGSYITFRYFPKGFILNNASNAIPIIDPESMLAFLSSKVSTVIANILNATTNLSNGVVARFPYLTISDESLLEKVKNCIIISKLDWDSHETSWNFMENPLLPIFKQKGGTLEQLLSTFIDKWTDNFYELHTNEEELNRHFIDIYGLQNELTPDVPLNEITILQQKEIKIENGLLKWDKSVLLKQLISYAMGCWMGRYRLDSPGLHIAHPNPTEEELASYEVNGQPFNIDEDGIIPLMDDDCPFPDNAARRMKDFIAQVFGKENLAANLNYLNATLGRNMTLEKFFKNEFWKDHVTRYQKRPIYWLFQSSKRNPAFQVLVYMHRMDAYTCEKVRSYLLSYIEYLKNKVAYLETQAPTAAITRELDQKSDALKECIEYELRLHNVANQQIVFDLDDGVKMNYAKFGDVLAPIN